ncbi:MAG: AAA family ATPase [Williamsia herbipolensis]|nr:AAA family ATPase [Williamsia herbipolensis]
MNPDGVDVAVRLVGEVRVIHRDREVAPRVVGGQRCVEVFAYLAVHRYRDVHLEELASVVWPAGRPRSWNAALRGVLSRVRDGLEIAGMAPDTVRSRGGYVRMTLPTGVVSDLEHARRCSDHPSDDPVRLVRDARAVLGLLDGPVLPDVTGTWADEVRDEASRLRMRALEVDAEISLRIGEHEHAVSSAEQLIAVDPLRENAYRAAMRGHVGLGERARALDVAARCRQVLDEELGITPSPETHDLFLSILRAGDSRAPTGPTPDTLVGRSAELATVADAIDRAGTGDGQVVVVSGEAGSGKTSLIVEAMRRARDRGVDVVHGRCGEDAVVPFEPLVGAITGEIDTMDPAHARRRISDAGPGMTRLLPQTLRRLGIEMSAVDTDDRASVMTAVVDWLCGPGRRRPAVLVVDDLHWASPATLDVLRWVIRASERRRLCVVATVRQEYLDRPEIRSVLSASRAVHRVPLAGLTLAEVGAVVAAAGSTLDPAELWERTRGLPFFVDSLVTEQRSGSDLALPASIAESVARRVDLLSPPAVRLLRLCAVIGLSARRAVARVVADDLDDRTFADALDELARHRLLGPSDGDDEVVLRHPLVQEAVYADIGGGERATLHSRVATALEESGETDAPDDRARVAHHLSRGLDGDRRRASDWWRTAGDGALAMGAYEDAVAFYRAAAHRLTPRGDSAERCRLQVDLGRALRRARDPDFRPTLLGASEMARRLGDVDLQVTATLANDLQGSSTCTSTPTASASATSTTPSRPWTPPVGARAPRLHSCSRSWRPSSSGCPITPPGRRCCCGRSGWPGVWATARR